jgi:plastocyanin
MKRTFGLTLLAAVSAAILVAGTAAAKTAPNVVRVSTPASGSLMFNTKVLHAHPGKVKIIFANHAMLDHNIRIESGEHELGGTKTIGKGTAVAYVTLKKGTYNFYCSVAGHEDAGMKGKLVVS